MKITVKNARLAFPALFAAKSFDEGDPTHNALFIVGADDAQVKTINATIDQVAKDKWGAKAEAILAELRKKDRVCLHDGDTKATYDGFQGNLFVSASNPVRPTVVNRDKTPLTEADGVIYSGCYVHVILEIWAQDNKFGKRVNATLMGVQFSKDGEAFTGGGVASADDFDDLSTEEETADDLA